MKELFKALALAQSEFPTLVKGSSAGGRYKYADLPSIIKAIEPVLRKHNLVIVQPVVDGVGKTGNTIPAVKTILFHTESGESIESISSLPEADLKGMNEYQVMGSAITYFRRYSLCAILGVVSDEDDDTQSIPVKQAQQAPQKSFINQEMLDKAVAKKDAFPDAQAMIAKLESVYVLNKAQKDFIVKAYENPLAEGIALLDPNS